MKAARLVVLGVAVAAGGIAALLAGRSHTARTAAQAGRRAARDGRSAGRQDRSRPRPADRRGRYRLADLADSRGERQLHPAECAAERHKPVCRRDRARARLCRAADLRSHGGIRQRLRLHGRDPAQGHARGGDGRLAGHRRPAASSCPETMSTWCSRTTTRQAEKRTPAPRKSSAKRFCATCRCSRSIRRSRKRAARR